MTNEDDLLKEVLPNGHLEEHLYHFLRKVAPMSIVDVVLVPKSEKPQVILLYRGNTRVAANQ